jgi:ABC-type multidrug transport system fused ATPase/permease subunit
MTPIITNTYRAKDANKPQGSNIRTFKLFGEFKWRLVIVMLLGILGIVAFSMMPTYLKMGLDRLEDTLPHADTRFIMQMLALFMGLLLINEIFSIICVSLILKYEAQGIHKLSVRVKHKLDVVPTATLEKYTTGDLTRIVCYNTPEMARNILVTIYQISRALFFYATTSVAMFAINPLLACVVIASLPLCVFTARFVSKRTQKYFNAQNERNGELSTYIDQRVSLQGLYKMHGLDENITEFHKRNAAHANAIVGEVTCTGLNTMYITFIRNFMLVLVTVLCCILFNNALLAFAALPTFIMFSQRFLDQSVVVTNATNVLQILSARSKRVFEILDEKDVTAHERIQIEKIQGDIVFEKVTLIENGEKVVDNLSFKIPKGTSFGIVGPTGGGKHKVIELLTKLAVPTSGKITVDGIDLREIDSASYYDRIGISFEKPFVFKGTVAENLLYGVGKSLPEKVMGTAKKLKSHSFIEQLPQGYETELCGKTALLSISQKQAICVARTVLEVPDLLIMDSAMSFADNLIEREVFEEIMKQKNQTKVFVTHRLGSIQDCDQIMYLEKGKILEIGSHKQLMAKKKKYHKAFTGVSVWAK